MANLPLPIRATDKVNSVNDEEELRKQGYVLGVTLGEGSYAKVKAAFSQKLDRKVALKIINKKKAPKDFLNKFLPRELEVLKMVRHPNIIQLFQILTFNGKVFIAMELAGHGDLLDYVKLRGAIPEERARVLFRQLISAIDYLHQRNVIHRDLKCENILLDAANNIKVSDFGFSRVLQENQFSKTFCGSAAYAAPEILQGIPYAGPAYDIWSCGVILYIMVCGTMPYDDSNIKKMIKVQTERKVGFSRSKKISQDVKELIWAILEAEPKHRAPVGVIMASSWLQHLPIPATPEPPARELPMLPSIHIPPPRTLPPPPPLAHPLAPKIQQIQPHHPAAPTSSKPRTKLPSKESKESKKSSQDSDSKESTGSTPSNSQQPRVSMYSANRMRRKMLGSPAPAPAPTVDHESARREDRHATSRERHH